MAVLRTPDGLDIAYQLWERDSELPPVVLHHGFAADGDTNWVAPGVVDALVSAGRRVVTIDARGHGASSKPHDPLFYGEEKMAADVHALLDLLGESSYDLVGYSMGAIVSALVASRESRIRRLVVGGVGAAVVELGGVDTRVVGSSVIQALRADDPSSITDPNAAAFRMFAETTGADRLALAAQACSLHRKPIALADITAPCLVLAGEEDMLATRPEVLADAIPGATLRTLPGDHLGVVRNPEFTKLLVSFLADSDTWVR
ncbi:alpha/beta hydrolase [Saccharomonospora sp.]|uniref:alpha/beta fold hydrolase n=1 Tax=Saccharomonospora sp. TaxID=33913 RepID=UPI00262EB7C3|nr:alpha/beta hydrolase [Saccharomonospora sp.]